MSNVKALFPGVAGLGSAGRGRARLGAVRPITHNSFTWFGVALPGRARHGQAGHGFAWVRTNNRREK